MMMSKCFTPILIIWHVYQEGLGCPYSRIVYTPLLGYALYRMATSPRLCLCRMYDQAAKPQISKLRLLMYATREDGKRMCFRVKHVTWTVRSATNPE